MAQKLAKFPKLKVPVLCFLAEGGEKLPKVGNSETMIYNPKQGLTKVASSPATIAIEHPTGSIDVLAEYDLSDDGFTLISAGLIRTARKLADGNLYIPASIWGNEAQTQQSEPKGVRV